MLNIIGDTSNGKKFSIEDGKKIQICKWHFLPFPVLPLQKKSTSELTESPEENGKLYLGFHVREKINQLTSNLISRWGETIILNSLAHNYYFPLPVLLKMF